MLRLTVTAALFALLVTHASGREWHLTYTATKQQTTQDPKGDVPPRIETRSYTETIALGDDVLVVQNDRQKIIHDFSRRRFVVLNLDSNTYDEWSLFSMVDAREVELLNRNALRAALHSAKVDEAHVPFDRFDNETALHVRSLPNPHNAPEPIIEQGSVDNRMEFRHRNQTVVRFTPSDTTLPAELRHRFDNYLAYSCAIHPDIRHVLRNAEFIPKELVFTSRELNKVTTTTFHLVSAAPSDSDSSALPAAATPTSHEDDPVLQLIASIREAERTGRRPTRRDAVAFANSAFADGRMLDGLMALLEHGLQSGEQLTDEIRKHRPKFANDRACQIYLQAFDQSTKEACEQALAANASIDRPGLQRAYMLELQRANHLDRLGKSAEAIECYLTVIRGNPFHAGALHDLGMLLARTWEHPKAWLCWDTARRLYPDHPMFSDVREREKQLLSRYPEFF